MVAVIKPDISGPATSNTTVTDASPATERIKKFFEDKDWKFYAAVFAGVAVAGAGAYYLTAGSSSKKQKKSSSSKKKEADEATGKGKAPASDATGKADKTSEPSSVDGWVNMTPEAIASLTDADRAEAAGALKAKGNSFFSSKKYQEAIDFYTQAILFKPDPIFYSNRAACYANLGKSDEVIADCNEALKLDSTYIKALNRRAQALEKKGNLSDSLYDFTCVCILDGFKNETAAKAMERLLKKVSEEKAKELIKTKKQKLPSPTFVSAYLDSFHQDQTPMTSTEDGSGDAYYNRARKALQEKKYEEAMDAFDKAVELGCSQQAQALNMQGTFVFLKGDTKGAVAAFNKAIELDPKYVQTYIKRASIYMEQGDIAATFKQFEDAIGIDASNPDIYYHRGQVNYINGNFEAAAKDYSESIKLDDSFVYSHIQLGVVQYKLGSISSAMATFKNTLKKFENNADVHNYYGELLADQQKIEEAMEMFGKAVELDAKNPLPYINKAMLMYQVRGDVQQAMDLCKGALEADPLCDAAVASLAQILLEQGQPAEAVRYYEMAIDLARTEAELEHAISYVEATKTQIRFAQEYPSAVPKLNALRG
ncbi:hypothetical protein K450DRAFT_237744 [Umbelopsis ramanniana AG]|uniref:Uncharacterized protein n=1 Tax=Umbelopsis ramanniana AG TaxID=1314678 RepID=A0AAD5EC55_UMBRA|nr:uncharacterized protein K450DRAFT_237744 [Umbelopsis ramanniana AG]KAI8580286.1 hypothetical protein K450DRAFT_237744 [Umbelopsis ramanniana AG]